MLPMSTNDIQHLFLLTVGVIATIFYLSSQYFTYTFFHSKR